VYLPLALCPARTAPGNSPAVDASLQQSTGCLYALGAGAHNRRAASGFARGAIDIKKASHSGGIRA